MHRLVPILLCLAASLGSASAVDLSPIPINHRWVLHLDVQRALSGELGQWADDILADPTLGARVQLLEAVTGTRIREDLSGITLSGVNGQEHQAMVLVRGRFDRERIQTLAKAAEGHSSSSYRSHTIHHWIDAKGSESTSQFGCLVGDGLLLLARSESNIQSSLDTIDGTAPSLATDPAFVGLDRLDAAIVAGTAAGLDQWQGLKPNAAMLREVDMIRLQIDEAAADLTLQLSVTAKQQEKAQQLQQIGQGLIALYGLGQQQQLDPALQRLIQSLRISLEGSTVSVSTRLPVAELRRLSEQHRANQGTGNASP